MKKFTLLFLLFLILCCKSLTAQDKKQYEMKQYYMVFLMKGPDRTQDSATAAAIQKGHMEHMEQMASDKKLQVAGPFLDDGFYRGIFIFDVADKTEVEKLVKDDPAVKSGRLSYEIHPWMTARGTCFE